MALIKCPGCGATVSDRSSTCVHCGYLLKSATSKESRLISQEQTQTVVGKNATRVLQGSLPVVLNQIVLSKTDTGSLLAVCEFISIADKPIQAMSVDILCSDIWGKKLAPAKDVQYLDLITERDKVFGEAKNISIPDPNTRMLEVVVQRVMLADGTLLLRSEDNRPIAERRPLSQLLDQELVNEYREITSSKALFIPQQEEHIWNCACGAINRADEDRCHSCHTSREKLFEELDKDKLLKRIEKKKLAQREAARIKAEQDALAEREREQQARHERVAEAKGIAEQEHSAKETLVVPIKKVVKKRTAGIVALCSIAVVAAVLISLKVSGVLQQAETHPEEPITDNSPVEQVPVPVLTPEENTPPVELTEDERLYREADRLAADGKFYEAATTFYKIKYYKDSWDRCFSLWGRITCRKTFVNRFGISPDGTIVTTPGVQLDRQGKQISEWSDLEAIVSSDNGNWLVCGLTKEGKVLLASSSVKNEYSVSDWEDIVAISVGGYCIVGLKADGTVLAESTKKDYGQSDVSQWHDIVMVATSGFHTVGLKTDGTVVATGLNQNNQCEVGAWASIVAVSASDKNTIGLKADGTVVAVGSNQLGQCDVSDWQGITKIESLQKYTVGLKADGTVIATRNMTTQVFNDLVDITGVNSPFGLRSNGDVVWLMYSNAQDSRPPEKRTVLTGIKLPIECSG